MERNTSQHGWRERMKRRAEHEVKDTGDTRAGGEKKGNAWRANQSCKSEGEGVLSREGRRERGVKRRGRRGEGCCFKISTDECVPSLWGGGLLPFSVCHSTRLCRAREGDGRLKARAFAFRIISTCGFLGMLERIWQLLFPFLLGICSLLLWHAVAG